MKILLMLWKPQPWLHLMGEGEAITIKEVVVEEVDVFIALIARGWATLKRIVTHCMVFQKK